MNKLEDGRMAVFLEWDGVVLWNGRLWELWFQYDIFYSKNFYKCVIERNPEVFLKKTFGNADVILNLLAYALAHKILQ